MTCARRRPLIALALSALMCGCQTNLAIEQCAPTRMQAAANADEVERMLKRGTGKARVVVVPIKPFEASLEQRVGLSRLTTQNVQTAMARSGAKVLERTPDQLMAVYRQRLMKGKQAELPDAKDADYAVLGALNDVNVQARFVNGYYVGEGENRKYIQPACYYTGSITANFQVRNLRLNVDESVFELQSSAPHQRISNDANCPLPDGERVALLWNAAKNLTEGKNEVVLKNLFPPTGYVLAKRSCGGGKAAFLISVGQRQGVRQGDEIAIYDIVETRTRVGIQRQRSKVAKADVSNLVEPEQSWVVVKNRGEAARVKELNDAQVVYKHSAVGNFFGGVANSMRPVGGGH